MAFYDNWEPGDELQCINSTDSTEILVGNKYIIQRSPIVQEDNEQEDVVVKLVGISHEKLVTRFKLTKKANSESFLGVLVTQKMAEGFAELAVQKDIDNELAQISQTKEEKYSITKQMNNLVTTTKSEITQFVQENKSLLYWTAIIVIADQFIFEGKFREKIKEVFESLIKKVTERIDKISI